MTPTASHKLYMIYSSFEGCFHMIKGKQGPTAAPLPIVVWLVGLYSQVEHEYLPPGSKEL